MPTQPDCFGKLWEATAPECAGGYDAGYVSPSGSKNRPKCDWFDACRSRKMIVQAAERQPLITPGNLVRPPQPLAPYTHPPIPRPPNAYAPPPQPIQQHQQQQFYAHQPYPVVVTQPVQMMPTNYGMPAYLTSPEVRRPGESALAPLGREVFRSMGKAFGHSIAHFFDSISLSKEEK